MIEYRAAAARLRGPAIVVLGAALVGCAGGRLPPATAPAPSPDLAFLLPPLNGFEGAVGEAEARALSAAHADLVAGGDPAAARAVAAAALEADPDLAPAGLLAAQAELASGRAPDAVVLLSPLATDHPRWTAAQLALGWAAEQAGDLPLALEAYLRIDETIVLAAERAAAVRPRAIEIAANRATAAAAAGRLAEAEAERLRLRTWAPDDPRTLAVAAEVASAGGDRVGELAALRELAAIEASDRRRAERRAELELEVGEPGTGLRMLEELAAASPSDPQLAVKLTRARFLWRLQQLPAQVGALARAPALDRGDLAVLLYWLFPSVRFGQGGARIASDILEHPQKQQIMRVVNAGVMEVDPVLHRFDPDRRATRDETMRSLLRILATADPPAACAAGGDGARLSAAQVCASAARCGMIGSPAACLPGAVADGGWAVEVSQAALDQLAPQR